MTKEFLKEKLEKIKDMDAVSLDSFAYIVALSSVNLEMKKVLNKAIFKRAKLLVSKVPAMAVSSNVKMDGKGVEI